MARAYRLLIAPNVIAVVPERAVAGGGARGRIGEFSARSRRRMLDTLNRLVLNDPHFVTLTFHSNVQDENEAHAYFRRVRERVRRRFGNVMTFWVRERQKRGAVHYHLIVEGRERADEWERQWLLAVDAWSVAHKSYGVDVKPIESAQAVAYIAKYASKTGKGSIRGRYWANNGIPLAPVHEIRVSAQEAQTVIAEFGLYRYPYDYAMRYLGRLGSADCDTIFTLLMTIPSLRPAVERYFFGDGKDSVIVEQMFDEQGRRTTLVAAHDSDDEKID